jgi:hypothetical protein
MSPTMRRALAWGAVSLVLAVVVRFWPEDSAPAAAVSPADTVPAAERRLANLRATVATVPGKQDVANKILADLAVREKGLLVADTAAQAQAQLIQIFRDIGRAENPPVEIRSTDSFALRPLGDNYGEASVSFGIDCHIEQLVNILAAIAARPELVATSDLRIGAANPKEKNITVHLTISGVVPRKLVPEKKS